MRNRYSEQYKYIRDVQTLCVEGHGDVANDICDSVRNNTTAVGDIRVRIADKLEYTFENVQPGEEIRARISRIYENGTDLMCVEKRWYE